jgi:hypothetical protein
MRDILAWRRKFGVLGSTGLKSISTTCTNNGSTPALQSSPIPIAFPPASRLSG